MNEDERQSGSTEHGLFADGGVATDAGATGAAVVSAVRELTGTPKRVSVLVGGRGRRRVAVLLATQAMEMGLAPGVKWTDQVAARARHLERVNEAKSKAMRRLASAARSRAEMLAWLAAKGYDPAVAQDAVERLAEVGLIRDEDVAAEETRRGAAKGLSGRAIAERLAARGVDGALTGAGESEPTDRQRAMDVARRQFEIEVSRRAPGSVDVNDLARRVLASLARKGYDEEIARDAVERALGERRLRIQTRDDQ